MQLMQAVRRRTRPLARFGCISIGTVYVVVGVLALLALSGRLIEAADEDRMIRVVMDLPGGGPLIWAVILGLAGYVVWRLLEALSDPYEFGSHLRGVAIRAGVALSAAGYGFLAVSAARIASDRGSAGGMDDTERQQQLLVQHILQWPAGDWLVGAAGVIVFAVGAGQFVLVARRAYTTEIHMDVHGHHMKNVIRALAWYGYSARGVILCVLGYFLLRGALTRDPTAVGDTDTAFDFIGGGAAGDIAFLLVALGTVAYGLFMYLNAWYYKFEHDQAHGRDGP